HVRYTTRYLRRRGQPADRTRFNHITRCDQPPRTPTSIPDNSGPTDGCARGWLRQLGVFVGARVRAASFRSGLTGEMAEVTIHTGSVNSDPTRAAPPAQPALLTGSGRRTGPSPGAVRNIRRPRTTAELGLSRSGCLG